MRVLSRFAAMLLAAAMIPAIPARAGAQAAPKPVKTAQTAATAAPAGEKIDINSATADQLKTIPGIGDAYAKRIIAGRPYANKTQLTSKGVLPQGVYDKVKDRVVASQAKK